MEHFLQDGDFVGVSFWIVSVAMVAELYSFFMKEWQ